MSLRDTLSDLEFSLPCFDIPDNRRQITNCVVTEVIMKMSESVPVTASNGGEAVASPGPACNDGATSGDSDKYLNDTNVIQMVIIHGASQQL